MGFNFAKFFRTLLFGGGNHPTQTPSPDPPYVPPLKPVGFVVFNSRPEAVVGAVVSLDGATNIGTTNGDGYAWFDVPASLTDTQLTITHKSYKLYSEHAHLPDHGTDLCAVPADFPIRADQTRMPPIELLTHARRGTVVLIGRSFIDVEGAFYPLGATLMWALRGWKFDRARVKANLLYLAKYEFDYVRILGHVEWPGNEIDFRWPDYPQILAEFLDYAYSIGLRVEFTLLGTLSNFDPVALCQLVAPVITARPHTILSLEMANEWYKNGVNGDLSILTRMARACRQAGITNILALSSAEMGITWEEVLSGKMLTDGANLQTMHPDRNLGDEGWRAVRQAWDWRDVPFAVAFNEPIGPRSSGAEMTDPLKLAMLRATGIINGVGAFVLHNGAGVQGLVDDVHNRPANLWEVPGIDAVMYAVRGIDRVLMTPARLADGRHWNNQWAGNPFHCTSIWPDTPSGVNRSYLVETPTGFVACLNGIKGSATYVCERAAIVSLYDPVVGEFVQHIPIAAGAQHTITPTSFDEFGNGGFIAIGEWV